MGVVRRSGANEIARPELAQRIASALHHGPVLIVADAGFGKTVAVGQALDLSGRAAAWVSCARVAGDAGQMLTAIEEAVDRVVPGAVVAGEAGAEPPFDAASAARQLARELARLAPDTVLVFDDAEALRDGAPGIAVVGAVLGESGPRLPVAVLGRAPPALPIAADLAAGTLTAFGPEDLLFTLDECRAVLAHAGGGGCSAERAGAVLGVTGGWPLGVRLAAVSADDRALSAPGRSRDALFAYLADDVLATLSSDDVDATLRAAIPEILTPRVAEALGLPPGFGDRALFMARVGAGAEPAWRYHPLFRTFLLDRLLATASSQELTRLRVSVAGALATGGRWAEAVEHWLDAERWTDAVDAMAAAGVEIVERSPALIRRWLAQLPEAAVQSAAGQLVVARLEWRSGSVLDALAPLERAAAAAGSADDRARLWEIRRMLVDARYEAGRFEDIPALARDFDDPDELEAGDVTFDTARRAAYVLALGGRWDESQALFTRLEQHPAARRRTAQLEGYRAWLDYRRGRIDSALTRQRRAAAAPGAALERGDLGSMLSELGQHDAAVRELTAAAAVLERDGRLSDARLCHWWAASSHAAGGRADAAEAEMVRGGAPDHRAWRTHAYALPQAQIAALRGDAASVAEAVEDLVRDVRDGPLDDHVFVVVSAAGILADAGRVEQAMTAVADASVACDRSAPGEFGRFYRARLLVVRAWLAHRLGAVDEAHEALRRGFDTAGEALIHVLRPEWPRLRELTWEALERGTIDGPGTLRAMVEGLPDVADLLEFAGHPVPEVRAAAISGAIASGHPEARSRAALAAERDARVLSAAEDAARRLAEHPPPLAFTLFGGFTVHRGRWPIAASAWERPATSRLVRFLLLHRERAVPEDDVFDALWPDRPSDAARRSLHVAVSQARRVLDLPHRASALVVVDRTYRIAPVDDVRVDTEAFEHAARTALDARDEARPQLLRRAAELWTGEPLPEDRYERWSSPWRERLTDLRRTVLFALADAAEDEGDQAVALDAARTLTAEDPLDERAHRLLMTAQARAGRRAEALRQYLECHRELVDRLGVEPSAETTALHARILAGTPV